MFRNLFIVKKIANPTKPKIVDLSNSLESKYLLKRGVITPTVNQATDN